MDGCIFTERLEKLRWNNFISFHFFLISMIKASIIENSRKEKTTEVNYNGFTGSCPSGASTGANEAAAFRRNIEDEVKEFNKIAKNLEKIEIKKFWDLKLVEEKLKNFGANIIISTEFAILHSKQGYKWLNPFS